MTHDFHNFVQINGPHYFWEINFSMVLWEIKNSAFPSCLHFQNNPLSELEILVETKVIFRVYFQFSFYCSGIQSHAARCPDARLYWIYITENQNWYHTKFQWWFPQNCDCVNYVFKDIFYQRHLFHGQVSLLSLVISVLCQLATLKLFRINVMTEK